MKFKVSIILLCLVFLSVGSSVLAEEVPQEMNGEMVITSPSPVQTITPTPDYVMPYPGILPDSPLYSFKTARDRVISIMIGDPLKKAEFDLLQADKRIGAALLLIKTGNTEKQKIALSTVSKGQNYFEEAIAKLEEAKKQGNGANDLVTNMKRAIAQHTYSLQRAKPSLHKSLHPEMDVLIKRSESLESKAKTFK